ETSVKLLKKLRLLQKYLLEDPHKEFTAQVTRVKSFGLFFEIAELMLEGFLHISELEDDYFIFSAEQNRLKGRMTGISHFIGEEIKVHPQSVDFILLESKWELITSRKRPTRRFVKEGRSSSTELSEKDKRATRFKGQAKRRKKK
ncbi:MAG: S1 RNA-binding domain-containing protein, partial [Anaerolineae bacterium]